MDFMAYDAVRYHWEQHEQLARYGWKVRSFEDGAAVAVLELRSDDGALYLRDSLDLNPLDQGDSAAVEAWLRGCLRKAADVRRNSAPPRSAP